MNTFGVDEKSSQILAGSRDSDDVVKAEVEPKRDDDSSISAASETTDPKVDAVEAALAAALKGATAAGEWSTVARLADELQARRLARANVVSITKARSSK